MKRIGILTFWNVPNYGAFMQAYALQKAIQNRYNEYDVVQISHLHKRHYNIYYSKVNFRYRYWFINPKFYKGLLKNLMSVNKFKRRKKFIEYYKCIPHIYLKEKIDILDYLVLGSDIIWDYNINFFGRDKYLFGIGINAKRKISYAPSFGTVKKNNDVPNYVVKGLQQLNDISVRDGNSLELVKNIVNREARLVLDPTLIWDFETDNNIVKPDLDEEYIVVYGSYFTEILIDGAKEYCKKNNLRLVCLSSLDDKFDWCDIIIDQDSINPFEWTGYFKYAKAIMTCTYHGLMFGLVFKKNIVFNPTPFIMDKAENLIDILNLKDVLIEYQEFNEKISWNWDYNRIDGILGELRKNSYDYLDGAFTNGK